jgi:hypothetical protein
MNLSYHSTSFENITPEYTKMIEDKLRASLKTRSRKALNFGLYSKDKFIKYFF